MSDTRGCALIYYVRVFHRNEKGCRTLNINYNYISWSNVKSGDFSTRNLMGSNL